MFVFRPSALFYCFIVLTVCLSVMNFVHDFIINNNNNNVEGDDLGLPLLIIAMSLYRTVDSSAC